MKVYKSLSCDNCFLVDYHTDGWQYEVIKHDRPGTYCPKGQHCNTQVIEISEIEQALYGIN